MVLNIDFMVIILADIESFLMRVLKVGHPHLSPHVTFLLWERLYHSLSDFLYNKWLRLFVPALKTMLMLLLISKRLFPVQGQLKIASKWHFLSLVL